jgi:hypothetical protein
MTFPTAAAAADASFFNELLGELFRVASES